MTFVVLSVLLGLTAVLLAMRGAWLHALIAGLLAMAAVYVAAEPLAQPAQAVVQEGP